MKEQASIFVDYFSYKIGEDNQQCDGDALVFQGTQCVLLRNEKESDQIRLVVNKICKGSGNGRFAILRSMTR